MAKCLSLGMVFCQMKGLNYWRWYRKWSIQRQVKFLKNTAPVWSSPSTLKCRRLSLWSAATTKKRSKTSKWASPSPKRSSKRTWKTSAMTSNGKWRPCRRCVRATSPTISRNKRRPKRRWLITIIRCRTMDRTSNRLALWSPCSLRTLICRWKPRWLICLIDAR